MAVSPGSSSSRIRVLLTGAGAPGAAGILQCLQEDNRFEVHTADADPDATGRYLGYPFHPIPPATDPGFAEAVLAVCVRQGIRVLLPLVTRELLPLALHREHFSKAGVHLIVSSAASLEVANDKVKLYQFLEWRGLALPAYRVVEEPGQLATAAGELGYPAKKVCFKPAVGNGSRGFRILSNGGDELDRLFREKPSTAVIRLEDATRILNSHTIPPLLVTEYLPGPEYSVDVLTRKGEVLLVLPRLRQKMINGISVKGQITEHPEIIDYCRAILKELPLDGPVGIQVKESDQGEYRLLEINPRLQGASSACRAAGINLPVLAVQQALGEPWQPPVVNWGARFGRYWQDVFYET